jgi:predicted nucleic acid-binding protein
VNTYTLDASATLALIYHEPGYEIVEEVLQKAESKEAVVIIHKITLLEVYKKIYKDQGSDVAKEIYDEFMVSPIVIYDTLTQEFLDKFAEIQVKCKTHFADTFVATTNLIHTDIGTIITSDHDFDVLRPLVNVIFFR